jgi:hypothetical protein
LQPIAQPLEVLPDAELHDLGAVPDLAQMCVNATHHRLRFMTELARDCVGRHRGALVERLQPGGAVGVPERLRPKLPAAEASTDRNAIEQLPNVDESPLFG